MALVINNLYIGSLKNATNYYWLKDNKIQFIINLSNTTLKSKYFKVLNVKNFYDDEDLNEYYVYNIFLKLNNVIKKYINKYVILVNCFAGQNRSAAVICFYLIKAYNINPLYAINLIKNINKKHRNIKKENTLYNKLFVKVLLNS